MYRSMIKVALVFAGLCLAVPVSAIELDTTEIGFPIEKIQMHGFFSQGFMKSSNNDVYEGSRDGSFDLREYGVNFSGNLTDELLLAAQIMGYSLGGQGGDEIFLHYGLADYRVNDNFGIRAGRMRIPAGLYNETRDIDMVRKSVILPQNVYSEYYRDYYSALDGGSIYGGFDLDDLGYLSYQAGIGKPITNESETGDFPYNFGAFGNGVVEGLRNISYAETHSANFQLLYETPVDGLRVGYTWRRLDAEFAGEGWVPAFGVWVPMSLDMKNYVNQIYSIEYQVGRLTLVTEAVVRTSDGTKQNQGWYSGIDYDLTDKLGAGVYYAEYVSTDESTDYKKADQKTISLFSRYNITDSWLVKGQVDFNDGNGNAPWPTKRYATDGGDSVLFSVKTTWSF